MLNIQTDSRKIKPGDTFVAVKCEINDGHKYIDSAIKNGATKIIVERKEKDYGVETIVVPNTREYVTEYLEKNYKDIINDINLIGITGTNGKTTTAYLIYEAFNKVGVKCGYIGTVGFYLDKKITSLPNTSVDICDTYDLLLQAYDLGYKTIVMEVSSHALVNNRLKGLSFKTGLFTNLTEDHLDFHKTMENYALAKQILFKNIRKDGAAIINNDDQYKQFFNLTKNKNITYGFNNSSDYQIVDYKMNNSKTLFTYKYNNESYSINMNIIGKYNIYNALLTIIVLLNNGIKYEQIKEVFPSLTCPPGRLEVVPFKTNSIIIDYAHTPDAIEKVIETIKPITKGKLYTIFGCTGDRERAKRPIMSKIATDMSEYVIMTSDDPHNESMDQIIDDMTNGLVNKNYEVIVDRGDAIEKGISLLKEHDSLLILGKGHEEYIIVKDQFIPFNDRKVVNKILEASYITE